MLRCKLHQGWQKLPQPWRRALLFRVTQALAPRPDPIAPAGYPEPIIVAGFLTAATGLGEWARLALQAFTAAGYHVRAIDLSAAMMQGSDLPMGPWRDGRDAIGSGTLMLHVNAPYVPLALKLLGRKLVRGKKVVGCWAWELPALPPDWLPGFPFVHAIWALSDFTATAIKAHTDKPVRTTPLPMPEQRLAPVQSLPWQKPAGCFAVLTMFNMASGYTRKNPLGAIAAFQQAFGARQDCRLVLKIVNADCYPAGLAALRTAAAQNGNIDILTMTLPPDQNSALIAACDAVLTLHRAEGFALVAAEGMLLGKPVVATGWSGNLTFMNTGNSCLVPYALVPACDPQTTYDRHEQNWAEPDIAAAAAALQKLQAEPDYAARLGAQARSDILRHLSLAAYAAQLGPQAQM